MSRLNLGILFSLFTLLAGINGFSQNRTIPLELITPYPTFHNLAMEWSIKGDDNQNGMVALSYRKKGDKNKAYYPQFIFKKNGKKFFCSHFRSPLDPAVDKEYPILYLQPIHKG